MTLSIVILNYKSEGLVRYCLTNILKAGLQIDYEIIVVDNASPHNGVQKLKTEFSDVRFIELNKNKGFSAGNNAGIKEAKGKYIIIMNPDIVVSPGSLEDLIKFMDNNPDVGCAGPKLMNPDGSVQSSCLRFPSRIMPFYRRSPLGKTKRGQHYLKNYLMLDFDHKSNIDVDWLFGACLIVRRSILDDVGLMDEGYFLYIGDTDWCRMFWEKGYRVHYVADSQMIHYHHRESATNPGITGVFNYVTRIHIKDFVHYMKKFKRKSLPTKTKNEE
ncbi:MAG: glycosyltransferase family 2 protein [Candidatus Marinimicrobia bacterium]|nr:glycosyltransferase family 2 protein [Candidatus Neomarinimicrobiota bacterium]